MTAETNQSSSVHPSAYFPEKPFAPSPHFLAWLAGLPITRRYERELEAKAKVEALAKAHEREQERIEAEQRRAMAEAAKPPRSTKYNRRKEKHVVLGRLHLMEDDDPDPRGRRRNLPSEVKRFVHKKEQGEG